MRCSLLPFSFKETALGDIPYVPQSFIIFCKVGEFCNVMSTVSQVCAPQQQQQQQGGLQGYSPTAVSYPSVVRSFAVAHSDDLVV